MLQSLATASQFRVSESFDSGRVSEDWSRECTFDYSCSIVDNPSGRGDVVRFEWRKEDVDDTRDTLGAEFYMLKREKFNLLNSENEFWYTFDIYLPNDSFRNDSEQVVITQLHGLPDRALGEPWRNPVAALYIEEGQMWFRCNYAPERVSTSASKVTSINQPIGRLVAREWLDFVLRLRFDYTGRSGIVQLWKNGELVIDQVDIGCGYNDENIPYFKMGMYYWSGNSDYNQRVIYFDNIEISQGVKTYETFTESQ